MNITLGNKVKDIVTGFEGIAIAKIEYLNGCKQFCVQPPVDKDGKRPDGVYLDHQQLEVVSIGVAIEGKGTGGPSSNAPQAYRG